MPNIRLAIYGSPDLNPHYFSQCVELVETLQDSRISLNGFVSNSDLSNLLKTSHCGIVFSEKENFSFSLIDFVCSANIVITNTSVGASTYFSDQDMFILPSHDCYELLAQTILKVSLMTPSQFLCCTRNTFSSIIRYFMPLKIFVPALLFVFGFRPFGLTLIYLYFIFSSFYLIRNLKYSKFTLLQLYSLIIFLCIPAQYILGYPFDLILWASYLPFLFAPIIYASFRSSSNNLTIFSLYSFPLFAITISFFQFIIQIGQFLSNILGFDLSTFNALVIPVQDYSQSVFLNAGLSMNRFSGIFNQPLDAGVFWFSIFMLHIYIPKNFNFCEIHSNSSAQKVFWKWLAPIFSVIGTLLCGSKIFLLICLFWL